MNNQQKEDTVTLEILQTIENQSDLTQRHLADKLDVALGLANLYLKRCLGKGLIKIKHAPANRYLYYLTPKGFAEKSRLTASYLSSSFNLYRDASLSINNIYQQCEEKELNRILFCGISELAEIASIRILDYKLEIVGVFEPNATSNTFLGFQVWKNLEHVDEYDAILITGLEDAQEKYDFLRNEKKSCSIFSPLILGIKTK